jgi:hypothetical protein
MPAQYPGKCLALAKSIAKKGIVEVPLAMMMPDSLLLAVSVAILATEMRFGADSKANRARQLFANPAHASPHPPECRQPSTRNSLTSSVVAAAPFNLIPTGSEIHIYSAERDIHSQSWNSI